MKIHSWNKIERQNEVHIPIMEHKKAEIIVELSGYIGKENP